MWFLIHVTQPLPKPPEAHVDAVLPPDGGGRAPTGQGAHDHAEASRIVARWMDDLLRIPGTNVRIGLDPLIGLIPVAGGLISSCVSLIIILEAARLRMPITALLRMSGNVFVNALLDSIPVAGDFASIFFRSNSRNLALIQSWQSGEHRKVKRTSGIFVVGFFIVFVLLMVGWAAMWIAIAVWLWHRITGQP